LWTKKKGELPPSSSPRLSDNGRVKMNPKGGTQMPDTMKVSGDGKREVKYMIAANPDR